MKSMQGVPKNTLYWKLFYHYWILWNISYRMILIRGMNNKNARKKNNWHLLNRPEMLSSIDFKNANKIRIEQCIKNFFLGHPVLFIFLITKEKTRYFVKFIMAPDWQEKFYFKSYFYFAVVSWVFAEKKWICKSLK